MEDYNSAAFHLHISFEMGEIQGYGENASTIEEKTC